MSTIRITKEFKFETSHILKDYDGLCRNIHGHSYRLLVTLTGIPINDPKSPKNGMVMDFGDLKVIVKNGIINKLDHAVVLNENSPHRELANTINDYSHNVVLVPYQPTSENMLLDFAERIQKQLPQNVLLHSLKLYETANSYAEWHADDQH